jgi:hypothetical protein
MNVIEQQIDVTLPAISVRMLVVQPFLELQTPIQEPFNLRLHCVDRLLRAIDSVFTIAQTFHPHFVVFPEFCLPGVAGVERIVAHMNSAPIASPIIVMGGVSGLTRAEYQTLCGLPGMNAPAAANAPDAVPHNAWVNTSVTFVKDDAGTVSMWAQPKLSPAWPEANLHHQSMFQGSVVRVFRGKFENDVPCRFLSLLCFDWIGRENGQAVPRDLLVQLNTIYKATGAQQPLQWVFVLQYNRGPNHYTFLNSTNTFLTNTADFPFVLRHDAAVIMACTASSSQPASRGPFGYSSLIFSPRAPFDTQVCQPTFSTQSNRMRSSDALGTCKDAVFREMGECIHAADVRVPNFVTADASDRTPALQQAAVYPLIPPSADPRMPGASVPAVVKWTNDELDTVPDFCVPHFNGSTLADPIRTAQLQSIATYRLVPSQELAVRVNSASANRILRGNQTTDPASDADNWDQEERHGLRHVMQTLSLLGSVSTIDAANSQLHARHEQTGTEIAAIRGNTHADCMKAFKSLVERTHSPIVFVSRDEDNTSHLPREVASFTDPREGAGVRLTDSQHLLEKARNSAVAQYTAFVADLMSVGDRRYV